MLRWYLFCYGQPIVMYLVWQGQVVHEFTTKFGSQQGDPLGGHYFVLGTLELIDKLIKEYPNVLLTSFIDDSLLSGSLCDLVCDERLRDADGDVVEDGKSTC